MTIDEAIKREENMAEEFQRVVDMLYYDDTGVIEEDMANYQRGADEHRQLAAWLKDYIKKSSPQALKANMRIVGATEHALLFYRSYLPKFRNGVELDKDGKPIRGTGSMVLDCFEWERDSDDVPKIHPTQKPVKVLKRLIEICTDPGDVVIDPCFGLEVRRGRV